MSVVVQNRTYWSQALRREQAYVCLLPEGAAGSPAAGRRYPLLVLLHGLGGGPADWLTNTRLVRYLAAYDLVVACPDGASGWYTNAFDGSARYEDDLIQEFLPHLQATLSLQPPGKAWGIGGLSMGGYGAVKLALKHPKLFSAAVSHSGAFELPMAKAAHPVFGDPKADLLLRKAENAFALAELALCRFPTERPRLWLDCGTEDELLGSNRRFKDHLAFIGYPHTYQEMPGYHTWPYWDRAFRTALPEVAEALGAERARRFGE